MEQNKKNKIHLRSYGRQPKQFLDGALALRTHNKVGGQSGLQCDSEIDFKFDGRRLEPEMK